MLKILRGGDIFIPEPLGIRDVVLAGGKIAALVAPGSAGFTGIPFQDIDCSGKILAPGFVDSHVHILGGGGEGGPATRAPEIELDTIISSGVTTLIGCLGTDGITRHMSSLLAKANALEQEGITTFIFTGSYEIPVKTLTGSVRSDLVLIDKAIGAGEIALSDHRSSQPTFSEFARLAAECRVGGMLGGKAGTLHCHLGSGSRRLELLFRLLEKTEIPATQVVPTHINRSPELLEEGIAYVGLGGFMDITAGPDPEPAAGEHLSVAHCLNRCRERQVPLFQMTVSSDSNGSMPVFDAGGRLAGLTIATQASLLANFRHLISSGAASIPEALRLFTLNPATCYRLKGKGEIKVGHDADMIAFDRNWNLTDVIARGRIMMAGGRLEARGTFSVVP